MDTVAGKQIGRMRIELPGRYEENVVPVGFLREQGLQVDVVDAAEAADAVGLDDELDTEIAALVKDGAK